MDTANPLFDKEIENLDSLTSLNELWLGKNKITELKVNLAAANVHAQMEYMISWNFLTTRSSH